MIYGLTYSDDKMTKAAELCKQSMLKNGVEYVSIQCSDEDHDSFWEFNHKVLSSERGCGYWLWKPYIILRAMLQADDGDILIYSDAGVEFINSVHHIVERMDENVFLFTNTHPNHHWTKKETLDAMYTHWDLRYKKDSSWPQVQASVMFFKVCQETRDFVKKWLLWCQMPDMINDVKGEQLPYFQDHRHDQSIISILVTQAGYKLHWWPTQYSEHIRVPGDTYPVIFNHHRKRNNEW